MVGELVFSLSIIEVGDIIDGDFRDWVGVVGDGGEGAMRWKG